MWGYKLTSGTPVSIPATIVVDGEYLETLSSGVTTLGDRYFSEQAEQEIEIIEIQANDSLSALDKGSMVSDTFSDANGYLNSVNTGNTTSDYINGTVGYNTKGFSTHGKALSTNGASDKKLGLYFIPTANIIITGFIKKSTAVFDTTYIHSGNGSVLLKTITHAINATTVDLDVPITLTGGVEYTITGDLASTGSYNSDYSADSDIGITNEGILFVDGSVDFVKPTTGFYNFEQLIIGATGAMVEIDLPTITGTILQTMVLINGTANVTYELEDASANTQSGLSLNTKNNIATLVTAPIILRLNLNTLAANIKTYTLVIVKS